MLKPKTNQRSLLQIINCIHIGHCPFIQFVIWGPSQYSNNQIMSSYIMSYVRLFRIQYSQKWINQQILFVLSSVRYSYSLLSNIIIISVLRDFPLDWGNKYHIYENINIFVKYFVITVSFSMICELLKVTQFWSLVLSWGLFLCIFRKLYKWLGCIPVTRNYYLKNSWEAGPTSIRSWLWKSLELAWSVLGFEEWREFR
jgi:hypothetical protein